jgi:uncharacterized iron-regulated protein
MRLTALIAACLAGWLMPAPPAIAQTPAHPLIGKIVDTRTGVLTELTDPAIVAALFPCGAITLLGEVHDNPDHHKMRAGLIQAERVRERRCGNVASVFEHISADQQDGIERFYEFGSKVRREEGTETVDVLLRFLEWDKSGWPPAAMFKPLFEQVIHANGHIRAGNPDRDTMRRVAKNGLAELVPESAHELNLDQPFSALLHDAVLIELEASHCGLMPKAMFSNMAVAQRFKDAHMADIAMKGAQAHGRAYIFAGNGHVRTDRGVPYYLKQRAPNRTVLSVAFVEVEDGRTDPATYGPRDPAGNPATDYVSFAAPAPREDPCEGMRKMMKK